MQSTMNSEVSAFSSSNAAINLISWMRTTAKKITAVVFTAFKKEKPVTETDKQLLEAIRCVEWRTWYDQQRIIRYIYTRNFELHEPELYTALQMNSPIKNIDGKKIRTWRTLHWPRFSLETRELLLTRGDWHNFSVNITTTDNSFERKLFRWFGNKSPETRKLLDGGKTKTQRFARRNDRIMDLYLDRIPQMLRSDKSLTLNGDGRQLLNALVAPAAIVHIPTAQIETVAPIAQEEAIEVVAETLPTEEVTPTPVQPLSKKMTIKELKAYAKVRRIHVPGRITKHRDIYDHIKSQLAQA